MTDVSCSNILENRNAGNVTHILAALPPPPTKSHRTGSLPTAVVKQSSIALESEISPSHQPPSQPSSLIIAPSSKISDSPCSSPTDPVTISPRSSISLSTDKSWSFFQKDGAAGWTNFEEHHHLLGADEDNSERHSSDDDADVWSITDEQREYYFNQFKSMQSDLKKKISGATAKEFFEKSKLPLIELSKIWQLSDVDKDGALSIDEFCTAMHLVVLRRNNIELPDVLPPSLVPKITKTSEGDVNIPNATTTTVQQPQSQIVNSPKQASPSELVSPQSKEWTKFNDSPTSSLSSPGMKPVNFDFSAASVEQDPKILHPVALRLSPEKQVAYSSTSDKEPTGPSSTSQSSEVNPDLMNGPVHSSSFSGTSSEPSKSLVASSSTTTTASNLPQGPKKEPPPPPPPRPKHNHIRSSSLDLNKLGTPPAVPPRVSPSGATPHKSSVHSDEHKTDAVEFADFANFDECDNANLHLKSGAFEIYKKPSSISQDGLQTITDSRVFLLDQIPTPIATTDDSTALLVDITHSEESGTERKRHPSAPPLAIAAATINAVPRDKRELLAAIQAHRERNMMLTLLNSELNQELAEIMEERIALEIQLEQMKPFS
ncbi:ralBP1-associated Eps domain-containing protein 1 isoform X2 [Parasteatoda tepidariorum]|uniref:ralBP1-associated Eps domain-containing protein 1 isoform X2 n=1 Tax=Parasteatoda tepidariorum TaxID=114398 RepID=UPI001C71D75B|nr:ralBP1-associated Eps domain-containing protein 1 isoform X2 [Parasteatoda tepidariorum]